MFALAIIFIESLVSKTNFPSKGIYASFTGTFASLIISVSVPDLTCFTVTVVADEA